MANIDPELERARLTQELLRLRAAKLNEEQSLRNAQRTVQTVKTRGSTLKPNQVAQWEQDLQAAESAKQQAEARVQSLKVQIDLALDALNNL